MINKTGDRHAAKNTSHLGRVVIVGLGCMAGAASVTCWFVYWPATRAGESQVLFLRGEAGIGKTALLDYLAQRTSGCRIVRLLARAKYRCTRAITIDATPGEVWPWLVQVGYRRAGWYAGDLLDNFARPSVRRIVPELQDLRVGQWLAMVPKPSERTAFVVDSFAEPSWLLWRAPNRSWAWRLIPQRGERTRNLSQNTAPPGLTVRTGDTAASAPLRHRRRARAGLAGASRRRCAYPLPKERDLL